MAYAERILRVAHYNSPDDLGMDNFAQYAEFVAGVAKELTQKQRDKLEPHGSLADWAVSFRRLYDDFQARVERDPMLLYRPKHRVAFEFHSSPAFIRYFRAGNRTSKTQSGYAEHYYNVTAQNRWRRYTPGHTFIVGLEYSKYAPNVFERKMFTGESGNPLSPMFPETGKWFYHYDDRKKIFTCACPVCAEAGKAQSCKHQKRTISLFSDEVGWEQLQGAVYTLGHFDEHVDEGWFDEAQVRLSTIDDTSLMITGTPLFGMAAWETRRVADIATGDPAMNHQDPENQASPPLVSLHEVSMFDAGIVKHEKIRQQMASMDEFAIKARIYGQPAPAAKNPVFDRFVLAEMYKACRTPEYVTILPNVLLEEVAGAQHLLVTTLPVQAETKGAKKTPWTGLRVWERPVPNGQYIAAVDSARGLAGGDASCCAILKVENRGMSMHLSLVAMYHGWINAFDYADEVFKVAVWYNSALVVVELTGGFGDPVVLRLKRNLSYWNIYRPQAGHVNAEFSMDARMGVDTNAARKPFMVAALQQFVRERTIHVFDKDTIDEMANFAQEDVTKDGLKLVTPRFRGAGGSHDDRVMALVIGTSTAVSTPLFDFQADIHRVQQAGSLPPDVRDSLSAQTEV